MTIPSCPDWLVIFQPKPEVWTTLPLLSRILLEWDTKSLYFTGTDLETEIRGELVVKIHQEGKASVSAKKII